MQGGFHNGINAQFVHAQFSRNAGKVETVEVRNRDFEPGTLAGRPCGLSGADQSIPLGLQIRCQVGREVEGRPNVFYGVDITRPILSYRGRLYHRRLLTWHGTSE